MFYIVSHAGNKYDKIFIIFSSQVGYTSAVNMDMEDSQWQPSTDEEAENESNVVTFNPRSTAITYDAKGSMAARSRPTHDDDVRELPARGGDPMEDPSSQIREEMSMRENTHSEYGPLRVRDESINRILSRLTPSGRERFLRALNDRDELQAPPLFQMPPEELVSIDDQVETLFETRSEVNSLLDSPVPEIITKVLLPSQAGRPIESRDTQRNANENYPSKSTSKQTFMSVNEELNERYVEEYDSRTRHEIQMPVVIEQNRRAPMETHRPKPYLPSVEERAKVVKNLFPSAKEQGIDPYSRPNIRLPFAGVTTVGNQELTTNSVIMTWLRQNPAMSTVAQKPYRDYNVPKIHDHHQTYPKLLPEVTLFSPSPERPDTQINRNYAERTGVGYETCREDGNYEYRYFEPIPTEINRVAITTNLGVPLPQTSDTFSTRRHIDPLLGGGKEQELTHEAPVNQYAREPGPPKYYRESGRAAQEFQSNEYRGNLLDEVVPYPDPRYISPPPPPADEEIAHLKSAELLSSPSILVWEIFSSHPPVESILRAPKLATLAKKVICTNVIDIKDIVMKMLLIAISSAICHT